MPQKTVDESALKAAARAYALSSSSNNNNKKKASTTTTTNPSYQTPPIKPTPPHPVRQTRAKGSSSSSSSTSITSNSALKKSPPFSARRKLGDAPQPPPPQTNHDNDDNDIDNDDDIEYNLFVRKLMDDNWGNVRNYLNNDDDDDDDYNIPTTKDGDDDDDEYDDDDEEFFQQLLSSSSSIHDDDLGDTSVLSTPQKPLPLNQQQQQQEPCSGVGLDPHVSLQQHHGMEAELGGLLEEELEAAVSTLLGNPASPPPPDHQTMTTATTPRTPASSSDQIQRHAISPTQSNRLVRLLQGHYQLLIQQALVAVRKAHLSRKAVHNNHQHQQGVVGDEKAEDLAEILDGAVGMLQDLDHVSFSTTHTHKHAHSACSHTFLFSLLATQGCHSDTDSVATTPNRSSSIVVVVFGTTNLVGRRHRRGTTTIDPCCLYQDTLTKKTTTLFHHDLFCHSGIGKPRPNLLHHGWCHPLDCCHHHQQPKCPQHFGHGQCKLFFLLLVSDNITRLNSRSI